MFASLASHRFTLTSPVPYLANNAFHPPAAFYLIEYLVSRCLHMGFYLGTSVSKLA